MNERVPRWLDDPNASRELKELVGSASADEPTLAELEHLSARIGPLFEPGGTPPPSDTTQAPRAPAKTPMPSTLPLRFRLGIGIGILGAAGALFTTLGDTPRARLRTGLHSPAPIALVTRAPSAEETPVPLSSLEVEKPEHAPTPAPSASATPKESELEMLERAHAALRSGRAQDALGVTLEHARAYPRGALSQEREVIAVEALLRLGRRAEAETRGNAFIQRFPNSSYARRLRSLLGIPGDGGS